MNRFVCIHGHFYQPPRENPWLEEIESQDSAYPYHDWNERITAECYEPNGAARILDGNELIVQIVNGHEAGLVAELGDARGMVRALLAGADDADADHVVILQVGVVGCRVRCDGSIVPRSPRHRCA